MQWLAAGNRSPGIHPSYQQTCRVASPVVPSVVSAAIRPWRYVTPVPAGYSTKLLAALSACRKLHGAAGVYSKQLRS